MSVPLAVLLIPFALFLLLYVLFSIFSFYHVLRFAVEHFRVYVVCFVFLAGSVLLALLSADMLVQYAWEIPLQIGQPLGSQSTLFKF